MRLRMLLLRISLFVLCACLSLGVAIGSDSPDAATINLADRLVIASQVYSTVQMYFGHWKGVPGLDLDKAYSHYIEQIIASDSRRDFDLASIEFVASLQNGHSAFGDKWLRDNFGQMIGVYAYPIGGEWTITHSSLADLPVGEVITALDDEPLDAFYQRNRKYLSSSSERWRQRSFFEATFLFPPTFVVTLKGGRKVSVTRKGAFQWPGAELQSIETRRENGVAILRVPAFSPASFEDSSVEFLKTLHGLKALVVDLRGNHGGSTPSKLVDALMDRPYRWAAESTAANIAALQAWEIVSRHTELSWGSDLQQPQGTLYRGPLYILADGGCYSACEDFLMPFKDNHRAMIVGERSGGSTGQPYFHAFGNGMAVSISTLRSSLPDGSAFEGIGVAPDVEVETTASDLKSGRDPVLAKALEMIAHGSAELK